MTGQARTRAWAPALGRRGLILVGVVACHAMLLAAMALRPTALPTPQAEPSTVTIALFDARRPQGPPTPERAVPAQVREVATPLSQAQDQEPSAPFAPPTPPPLDLGTLSQAMAPDPTQDPSPLGRWAAGGPLTPIATSQISQSASTCQMAALLQSALAEDRAVTAALAQVPRRSRSVANAIMLWDGAWIDADVLGDARALVAIQSAIIAIINAAPADCQGVMVVGPRLIPIPDVRGATLLALGSGVWRWEDLVTPQPGRPASEPLVAPH